MKNNKQNGVYGSPPDFFSVAMARGAEEQRREQWAKAEELYRLAIKSKPNHAHANYLLGFVRIKLGRLDEARSCFLKALETEPDHIDSLLQLGYVQYQLFEYEAAAASFRSAIARDPDNARGYNHLAETMACLGDQDEAIRLHLRAIDLRPDFADASLSLGQLYLHLGRPKEAERQLIAGLEANRKATVGYLLLAMEGYYHDRPDDVARMEHLFDRGVLSDAQRCYLAFALGRVYEARQEFDRAFDYLARGNRLRRKGFRFSIADERENFERLKAVFSAGLLATNTTEQKSEIVPIFIVGMPRSGTSLVEQILASHPEVFGAGELAAFEMLCRALSHVTGQGYPADVDKLDGKTLVRLGDDYLSELARRAGGAPFVTDKLPGNFRNIGMIRLALPQAIIVHCRRNPMDTCMSIYRNHFGGGLPFAYDQEELGHYYRLYEDLMTHWHRTIPGVIHDVVYEEMVRDTETQVFGLLAHCGLTFAPACLDFHKTRRSVSTMSNSQVRRPIYKDSVSSWKRYEANIEPLKRILLNPPNDSV